MLIYVLPGKGVVKMKQTRREGFPFSPNKGFARDHFAWGIIR
jgi:hypothetical protein